MAKGKLIVIEGACDGIGKTTQYNALTEKLEKDGIVVVKHHFPSYGTPGAAPVEKYLRGELGSPRDLSPYFVNVLYAIDRAIIWKEELKPAYDEGKTILLDRYTTSSMLYQSALIEEEKDKKAFINDVCDFEYNKLGTKRPDLVIFLTAPFDLVTKMKEERKNNDGYENDIHERDMVYMKKVYDNSKFVSKHQSWQSVECSINGNMRSKEDISEEIYRLVKKIY